MKEQLQFTSNDDESHIILLGEVCGFEYGKALKKENRKEHGKFPVYGSNGVVGYHDEYLVKAPAVVIGRKGAAGQVHYSSNDLWPIDTTYYVTLKRQDLDLKFLYYQLRSLHLEALDKSTAIPGLNRNDAYARKFYLPSLGRQKGIVSKLEELFSELDKSTEELKEAQRQLKVYRQSVLQWAFEGKLTSEHVKEGELPEGWKWVSLQEVCKLQGGVTKGRKLEDKKIIRLPYLRVANVQDGYLDLNEMKEIEVLEGDLEKYRLIKGDVLFTEGGDKDKLGRGSIWNEEIPNCIHQNHVFRGRPLAGVAFPKYISYYTQGRQAKGYFYKNAKQTVNLASINLRVLSNLPFPLSNLQEQEQVIYEIETRLSVADKLEETIGQSLRQAEVLRQSILKRAFEGNILAII